MLRLTSVYKHNKEERNHCRRLQLVLFVALLTKRHRTMVQLDSVRRTRNLLDHVHRTCKKHNDQLRATQIVSSVMNLLLLITVLFIGGILCWMKSQL